MGLPTAIPSAGRSGAPPLLLVARGTLLFAGLITLVTHTSPDAANALVLDRAELMEGQPWRLFTCHFTHWTWEHLAFDLFAFILLAWLCLERELWRTVAALGAAAIVIPVIVLAAHPEMTAYGGLSGLDSTLFVLLAGLLLREGLDERRTGLVVLASAALVGFAAKIGFELLTGGAVFAPADGFVPVPIAHVAGAVVGAVAAIQVRGRTRQVAA